MASDSSRPRAAGPMMVKGSAVASTLRAVEKLHGPAAVLAVRAALPAHVRAVLDEHPVLPVRWYPVEVLAGIHVGVHDILGHGDWSRSHAIGVTAAREDFGNIYAVAIRALDAITVWNKIERMWTLYNSRGTFEWRELRRGSLHCFIRDVAGYNPGMWNAVAGRGQQLITMTGARGADVRVLRSTESEAEFDGTWLE